MMVYLTLAAGLALLLGGGEFLVRGAVAVAARMGVSPMLIGLTLVGFGTSTPELMASIEAALRGAPGIAVGNVVGSNIANILLILGCAALILPMATNREAFRRDGTALMLSTLLFTGVVVFGIIDRMLGGLFLVLLAVYLVVSYRMDRKSQDAGGQMHAEEAAEMMPAHPNVWVGLVQALGGIAAVLFGASLLVDSAIVIARDLGLSETVIGLTLVAVGTSLPELATSVMAAIRRHGDVAFGNVVGSNIFNILGIAGTTALVQPLEIPPEIAALDIWVMLGATALLLAFAGSGWVLKRWEAALFLALYGLYMAFQFSPVLRGAVGLA